MLCSRALIFCIIWSIAILLFCFSFLLFSYDNNKSLKTLKTLESTSLCLSDVISKLFKSHLPLPSSPWALYIGVPSGPVFRSLLFSINTYSFGDFNAVVQKYQYTDTLPIYIPSPYLSTIPASKLSLKFLPAYATSVSGAQESIEHKRPGSSSPSDCRLWPFSPWSPTKEVSPGHPK